MPFAGITLQALWVRLENVTPSFPLKLDDVTKSFLWSSAVRQAGALQFYELPEPRPPLAIFNRFDFTDSETGICVEQVIRASRLKSQARDRLPKMTIWSLGSDL